MEISESDRDAYLDLLYDMYDADLVDVALETLGEHELFDGISAMLKDAAFRNLDVIKKFQDKFLEKGYNVRTFAPAGQDDIGGGCGQLWYVQRWLKSHQ